MFFEVAGIGKRFPTDIADVRPLSGVDSLVCFEATRLGESSATDITDVRPLAGVDPLVLF